MLQSIPKKALSHIDLIEDHFYLIDTDWTILNLNKVAAEYLGGEQEHIEGTSVWESFPVNEGMKFPFHMRKAMRNQSTERWEDYRPSHGHWFYASAFASEDGLIVICRDITEEKKSLEALEDTKSKLKAIFDSINDGHALLDLSGRLLSFNRVIKEDVKAVKGVELKEGEDFRKFLFLCSGAEFEASFKEALSGKEIKLDVEVVEGKKLGSWFRIVFVPVYDPSGRLFGVAYNYTCIDDLMAAQANLHVKNKKLEAIAWKQAHQVRGSMARIMGLFELIKTLNCTSQEKENYYHLIDQSIHELDTIVKSIIFESIEP